MSLQLHRFKFNPRSSPQLSELPIPYTRLPVRKESAGLRKAWEQGSILGNKAPVQPLNMAQLGFPLQILPTASRLHLSVYRLAAMR